MFIGDFGQRIHPAASAAGEYDTFQCESSTNFLG
jgi:hypothetical protein